MNGVVLVVMMVQSSDSMLSSTRRVPMMRRLTPMGEMCSPAGNIQAIEDQVCRSDSTGWQRWMLSQIVCRVIRSMENSEKGAVHCQRRQTSDRIEASACIRLFVYTTQHKGFSVASRDTLWRKDDHGDHGCRADAR